MKRFLFWLVPSVLVACGEGDLVVAPAKTQGAAGSLGQGSTPQAGAGGTSGAAGMAGATPIAGSAGTGGAVKRTVIVRDPLGALDPKNLLWDGDFEWSGPFVSQYGWAATTSTGAAFGGGEVTIVAGPQCRSGLKCAVLADPGIGGIAVAPSTAGMRGSVWVKVPEPVACGDVTVRLEGCFFDAKGWPPLPPSSTAKPDGWCRYEGVRPTVPAPCLFVERPKGATGDFLVDDARITADAPGAPPPPPPAPGTSKDVETVLSLQAAMRERRMRIPPPAPRPTL